MEARRRVLCLQFIFRGNTLEFWRCTGGNIFNADGAGPFGNDGVSFFHRHPGIREKHLGAFSPTPGEIAQEVLTADTLGAGRGIHSCFAACDEASQIVHRIPLLVRAV